MAILKFIKISMCAVGSFISVSSFHPCCYLPFTFILLYCNLQPRMCK